jgi:hypothetical protein
MHNLKVILPLPIALGLIATAVAQTSNGSELIPGVSPWVTLLATQGLAVLLVVWWIMKGYPDWIKTTEKQQELWRAERKDDHNAYVTTLERFTDKLGDLTTTIKQRPCQLDKEK